MTKASSNIMWGLIVTSILVTVCIVIRPSGLSANDGLSYFGSFRNTVMPYSLAFFLTALFYWKAAGDLGEHYPNRAYLVLSLRLMALLLIGLLITPHTLLETIHIVFGSTLFAYQLIFTLWLLVKFRSNWQNAILFLLELFSGLVALYYLPSHHGLLLQAQIIFQLAFGLALIRALNQTST